VPGAHGSNGILFALSNGHIGLRGTLDEGEPYDKSGTFLSGFYVGHPLPYPAGGYGNRESGQTIVNVTSGELIRLLGLSGGGAVGSAGRCRSTLEVVWSAVTRSPTRPGRRSRRCCHPKRPARRPVGRPSPSHQRGLMELATGVPWRDCRSGTGPGPAVPLQRRTPSGTWSLLGLLQSPTTHTALGGLTPMQYWSTTLVGSATGP
jgi:hypothetical protein